MKTHGRDAISHLQNVKTVRRCGIVVMFVGVREDVRVGFDGVFNLDTS
jgi:hypothetical protein